MIEKRKPYRNKKILQAAKDAPCFVNFPGCSYDDTETCARHFNESFAGKGGAQKADDIAVFYGCTHCENVYAGILKIELTEADILFYIWRAFYRTIRYLLDLGVIK